MIRFPVFLCWHRVGIAVQSRNTNTINKQRLKQSQGKVISRQYSAGIGLSAPSLCQTFTHKCLAGTSWTWGFSKSSKTAATLI
jgi:hypothetical protein